LPQIVAAPSGHVERRYVEVLPDWHKIDLNLGTYALPEGLAVARAAIGEPLRKVPGLEMRAFLAQPLSISELGLFLKPRASK